MTRKTPTCTVRHAVTGVCGKPAIHTFESRVAPGEVFGECAEHHRPEDFARVVAGRQVGDPVEIRRHGKVYEGRVTRVGKRGAVYATVTYGNGATREVRV